MGVFEHGPPPSPREAALPAEVPVTLFPPRVPDHELLRLIGRGSYGQVWLARNIVGTLRAVKAVFRLAFEHDRPFDREFAGLQRYEPVSRSHPGLVNILQIGRTADGGCFYYVMELADDANAAAGGDPAFYQPKTLAGELRRRGPLPLAECLDLALALASALGHLHQARLVHRDLKPSNIIFIHGRPRIADIGLVSESGDTRSLVGTEGFFPPQGTGLPQADLFALGKVLYEASTGLDRLRFPQIPPAWLSDPQCGAWMEFNEVLAQACETDPARRYQSAEEMTADLALLRVGKSLRRLHGLERRLRWARRVGGGALAVALVALAAYGLEQRATRRERATRLRIEAAEGEAKRQLAAARLAQARATHHSGLAGQRFDCLRVLAEAARDGPTLELRNEAVTALCLTDFRPARRIPIRQWPGLAVMEARGLTYVTSGTNGLLTLHRAMDDREIARLPGALPAGWTIDDLSPGGQYVSIRSPLGEFRVLSVARGKQVLDRPSRGAWVHQNFSPDGHQLLWCTPRDPWRLVDLDTGRVVGEWPVAKPIADFQFRPGQRQMAVALADEPVVELHDLETREVVRRWELPARQDLVVWDREGARLAGSGRDHTVRVWDAATTTNFLTLSGHENFADGLAFHPTDPWLVSSAWDGTTRLWDLRTGRQEALLWEWGVSPRFTADGRQLCYCGGDGRELVFCEVAGEKPCLILPGPASTAEPGVFDVAFDPTGRWLAAGFHDHLHLFDTATAACLGAAGTNLIYAVTFSADGRHLYWGGASGLARARVETAADHPPLLVEPTPLAGANAVIRRILASANTLAWDTAGMIVVQRDGASVAKLPFGDEADSLALSRDERWFAASERWAAHRVHLWETTTWREVRCLTPPTTADREQLLFTPDSQFLIMGGRSEYEFLRLADGVIARRLPRGPGFGYGACSPDGRLLALMYSRTAVALYAYPGLRQLALLETPQPSDLGRLAFDPTGQRLAVAVNGREEVLLWDLARLRRQLAAIGLDW